MSAFALIDPWSNVLHRVRPGENGRPVTVCTGQNVSVLFLSRSVKRSPQHCPQCGDAA